MSYDKRMKILSKLDSIDPAEALTAYPRIAEYDAITTVSYTHLTLPTKLEV